MLVIHGRTRKFGIDPGNRGGRPLDTFSSRGMGLVSFAHRSFLCYDFPIPCS